MKSITITEEQFNEAVRKANEEWKLIGNKGEGKDKSFGEFLMEFQNMAFGAMISEVLFKDENEDCDCGCGCDCE